jgi:DNA-binding transcriptional MerR regulator
MWVASITVFTVTVTDVNVYPMQRAPVTPQSVEPGSEWTVDELAARVGVPVRTIREYQTMGLVPAPRRQGRVGLYGESHLRRLELIGRLQARGYSLAGIGDLVGSWSAGADLGEVLGLEPDQLVHVDEPGAPASPEQLAQLLPTLIPSHLAALEETGVIERCGPDRFCIPSPSLLQLVVDAQAAGVEPGDVLELLGALRRAADTVAVAVLDQLDRLPSTGDVDGTTAFLQRGRGLLAHGVGRLALHRIGRELGIGDEDDVTPALRRVASGGDES